MTLEKRSRTSQTAAASLAETVADQSQGAQLQPELFAAELRATFRSLRPAN